MKKKLLSLLLALIMVLLLVPAAGFAEGETVLTATGTNLIKVSTSADFAAGTLSNLSVVSLGNGALELTADATEGTFTSALYTVDNFSNMVASWNASIGDGASVETQARALYNGAWTDWFSWGRYGMSILRGSIDSDGIDEFIPKPKDGTVTQVQFRVILRRNSAGLTSPVFRQATFSTKGGSAVPTYAETPVASLPTSKLNSAPAYSQLVRDPGIGGSICSPSTVSVLLNARNPSLDLLPEELALCVQDFEYGFGNWAFCTSAAGLYGYEAYAQYADRDILLQELANGRSVGLSVRYSTTPSNPDYLEGAYGSTSGHIITLVGYEYKDGIVDDDHLYFYSSDTYSPNDATSFHYYKWTQLDTCWSSRVVYIVSSAPETGAAVTGVQRIAATLEATGADNVYTLKAGGVKLDLTAFTLGKTSLLGHGVLAYTVQGFSTDTTVAGAASIEYANRIWVSANNTFYYNYISATDDGNLAFDAGDVLYRLGVPEDETRTITVYAMANNGRRYTATLSAVSKQATTEPENMSDYDTVPTSGNLVHVNLAEGTLKDAAVRNSAGNITLAGGTSGIYLSPIYSNSWAWEYLIATVNAVTPGNSSVELQARAVAELAGGQWSEWFTWGKFGAGVMSMSTTAQDDYLKLGTDMLTVRGASATANVNDVQLRVILRGDSAGNMPTVFGLNFTYKKSAYSTAEAVYTGETAAAALPASAAAAILPTSAYGHASGMSAWRFENMMLMMLNSQGSDALFEEVGLNGYDYGSDTFGNWAYTAFKAGLFGHEVYTQFGATTTLVKQALADGNIVGLYVSGSGAITTTNNSTTSQIVVYAYETGEGDAVTFRYVCPRGNVSELTSSAVLGTCTEAQLAAAIAAYSSASARGMMYVVGDKVAASSVARTPVAAQFVDAATIRLAKNGTAIVLPDDFIAHNTDLIGRGVVAYTLESEVQSGQKLAANTFYYDITVNANGTLALPTALQEKIAAGDKANLYVICNNGVTYTARIVTPTASDPGYPPRTLTESVTGITLSGNIASGAQLTVGPMTLGTGPAFDTVRSWMKDGRYKLLFGQDISLPGGFMGTLTISIPVGARYDGQTVTVLHCLNGTLKTYMVKVKDGKATFEVTSLSPFAVFATTGAANPPQTGDTGTVAGFVMIALALVAAAVVTVKRIRA